MRPVWSLELVRDTNAPLEAVAAALSNGAGFHRWHPRLKTVAVKIERNEAQRFEAGYRLHPFPGVQEEGCFEVRPEGERLLLVHRARFKGWPVILLMGWWRLRSHRMWERLVESL